MRRSLVIVLSVALLFTTVACDFIWSNEPSTTREQPAIKALKHEDADKTLASWLTRIDKRTGNPPIDLDTSVDFINEMPEIDAAF